MSILDTNFLFLNKKTPINLVYNADIKCTKTSFTSGQFISDFISSYFTALGQDNGSSQSEIEEAISTATNNIVSNDDDIIITSYNYGYDQDFDPTFSFMFVLLIYTGHYLGITESQNNFATMALEYMNNINRGYETGTYTLSNEVSLDSQTNVMHDAYAVYISDESKFTAKYVDSLLNDENFNDTYGLSNWSSVLPDGYGSYFFWQCNSNNEDYPGTILHLVIEYGDSSYSYYEEEQDNVPYSYSVEVLDNNTHTVLSKQQLFELYEKAFNDNKYFHIKIYTDTPIENFPLSVTPLTISSTSVTTDYDGLPHSGIAGITSGELLSGDNISITPIQYTDPGVYPSGFVYQLTYQQPQRCVYDITRDCGIINILKLQADLTYWFRDNYSNYESLTSVPTEGQEYIESVRATSIESMFRGGTALTSLDVSNMDTSLSTNAGYFVYNDTGLVTLNASNLIKSNCTNMQYMFYGCSSLTSINVSNWDTSSVTTFSNMFRGCSSLTSINVTGWNTSNATTFISLFFGCSQLTSIDLSSFTSTKVTSLSGMFRNCSRLVAVDMSNISSEKLTSTTYMFTGCSALQYLIISSPIYKFEMKDSTCGAIPSGCKILVPSALLDTYKNATNWSNKASQFYAIEDYTITRSNGQVTVTPKS